MDEAQQLNDTQLQFLVDIQNELNADKVFLSIFLVGQPELKSMVVANQNSEKMQIVGRFMSRQHEFHGIRNSLEVSYCLKVYDEKTEYPEKSGWSFSRFYAPNAYDLGWRLTGDSEILWKAFEDLRLNNRLAVKNEIPMEYFARTIEYLLSEKASEIEYCNGFSYNIYKEAAIISGYIEGSKYLIHPNFKK